MALKADKSKNPRQKVDKFDLMAVRVAVFLEFVPDTVRAYDELPDKVKQHFELMSYTELIRPLVHFDRFTRGWSVRRISICYGVTYYQAVTILSKCEC